MEEVEEVEEVVEDMKGRRARTLRRSGTLRNSVQLRLALLVQLLLLALLVLVALLLVVERGCDEGQTFFSSRQSWGGGPWVSAQTSNIWLKYGVLGLKTSIFAPPGLPPVG